MASTAPVVPQFEEGKYLDVSGKSGVWVNENAPLFKYDEETMYTALCRNVKEIPERNFLGERFHPAGDPAAWGPFEWITQGEAGTLVAQIGSALVNELGESPKSNIGICSPNCPAWIIAQYGMYRQSMVPVPLYPTLGESSIAFILEQTEIRTIFCANKSVESFLRIIFAHGSDCTGTEQVSGSEKKRALRVQNIVSMGRGERFPELPGDLAEKVEARGMRTMTWDELLAAGSASPAAEVPPQPDDLFGIIYTSGSTGTPKGAMITHRNVCNAVDVMYSAPQFRVPLDNWKYLSYLPLAHSMELELSSIMIKGRGLIGFCPSITRLFDDLALLKPDFFPTVPRVWKKFYDKVNEFIAQSAISKLVFDIAYASKKAAMNSGTTTWIDWDALVFNSISSKLGGNIKISMCGAAPLDGEIIEWLKVTCGIQTYQVYGLTESFAGIIAQVPPYVGEYSSIGIPMDRAQVRLVDVPEMNYSVHDNPPRGEIALKAPNVFAGYYKEPEKTAEVLTKDGWFFTGDCARVNEDGTMNIIDRKKNIFKLSQGEYVAVEMVEAAYSYASCVSQIWVWGNSSDCFLVAVVVPEPDQLLKLAAAAGVGEKSISELCNDPRVVEAVLSELAKTGRERKLKGYEIVKGVILEPEPWTPTSDVMTPTLKIKRQKMVEHYHDKLSTLCQDVRAEMAAAGHSKDAGAKQEQASVIQNFFQWIWGN